MDGIRLNKVAKELNVGIPTLVEYLSKKGYQIKANPNTRIDETQYEILETAFKSEHDIKIKANESDISNIEDGVVEFSSLYQGDSLDFKEKESDFIEKHYMKLSPPKTVSKIDFSQFDFSDTEDDINSYSVGETAWVRVTGLQDYGAFVQILNGPSGLIPNKDISWNRVQMASDYVSIGDVFLAKITNIRDDGKMSFSRRELLPNIKTVKSGDILSGTIVDEKEFGFIVKIGDFTVVLPWKEVHPQYYEVGDCVKCVVMENVYDEEKHRNKLIVSERKTHELFLSEHTKGEHVIGEVEKIITVNETRYLIVSCVYIKCMIASKRLIEPYKTNLQNNLIQKGQKIEFVFKKYQKNGDVAVLDMRPLLKELGDDFSSKHTYGEHVMCEVKEIREIDGVKTIIASNGKYVFYVSKNNLIEPYKTDLENAAIKKGQQLDFVYTEYKEKTGTVVLDMHPILKEIEREKIKKLCSTLKSGDVLSAVVVSVNDKDVTVKLTDEEIKAKIPREELSPNKVLNATDEVFVGEHIDVQYLGESFGKMMLSRKQLLEDRYNDELYDMDVDQLLATMGIHTRHFVGKIFNVKNELHNTDDWFITNLMSIGEDNDIESGKLLVDPVNGRNLVAILNGRFRNLVCEGSFYEVDLDVSDSSYRRKQGTPYLFCVLSPHIKEVNNPYKEATTLSYMKKIDPSANTSLANLLEEVGLGMYSGKKRMFFELLQNADDAASQNGVNVKVQIDDEYFTFTHDGYSFNKRDFDSIISAAKSTKSDNKKKTGYKGIGFKSVFGSHLVSIKTGGFTFMFNKYNEEYEDFKKFYFHVNEIEDDELEQAKFMKKYSYEYETFKGVKDIPWQLLPIWNERPYLPNRESIFNRNENVAIALKMDDETLSEYHDAIVEIFNDPRFMLFLRKTRRVQLIEDKQCLTIQKNISKNGELVTLVNSFNPENRVEDFRIFSLEDIPVNDAAFIEADVKIKREERINTRGEKEFYFVRTGTDGEQTKEITGVPDRIASATETTVSFAIKLDENKHIAINASKKSSFYAYLPMNENRFSFPFYINADFIPKSDREGINSDNPWNHYLFYILGRSLVKMVSDMASVEEPQYLNLLCPEELQSDGQETKQLVSAFNKGYTEALSEFLYILDDTGDKISSSSVVYDNSGLSEAIGIDDFYVLLGSDKRLPHPNLDAEILKNGIFGVEKLSCAEVVKRLTDNMSLLQQWVASAADGSRKNFFEWITQKNAAQSLIKIVPAFEFSDGWKSYSDLTDKTIILKESTSILRDDLGKLGFSCAICLYENHVFHNYFSAVSKNKLFSLIKECDITQWSFEERKKLFGEVIGVLEQEIPNIVEWKVFRNQDGEYKPLSQMFPYSPQMPKWIYPYMVNASEYWEGMDEYLIQRENVFSKIVIPNIDDILKETNITDVYGVFSPKWMPFFTKQLFSKNIPLDQMLYIVEQSNDTIKLEYIRQLEKLELSSAQIYEVSSDEYRVIKLAASTDNASSLLRNKIYIDGVELNKYAVRDEVSVIVNEQRPPCTFLLSELLPSYSSASQLTKVSNCFKDIPYVEKIFAQRVVCDVDVKNELVAYLSARNLASLQQFCFMMIYTAVRTKKYTFEPNIFYSLRYGRHQDSFVKVLEECYRMGVGRILGNFLKADYGRELFPDKIFGTYMDCDDYTLPRERVPNYILQWADNDDKKKFLFDIGIHDSESIEIIRRKSFKDGKLENIWNITETQIIEDFLDWIRGTFKLPVSNDNQLTILKGLCKTYVQKNPSTKMFKTEYVEDDISEATEWTDTLYKEWRKNSKSSIWIVEKELQYRMCYRLDTVLYLAGENDFIYFPASRRIYMSMAKGRTPAVIMADVYSNKELCCPFTKDDWDKIFRISVDKYQELESEKERLESEIERLRGLLEEAGGDAEVKGHGQEVERGTLTEWERKEINREARYAAKEFLGRNEDFDCSAWNPDDSRHLISGKIKYKGNPITVAVTSSMARKLYLHPRVFAELMQDPDNVLLNYGADKMIHSLSFDDIFSDNPNVNLIFDTDVVSPKRIAELANGFMGSKRTCFVIENPNYSQSDSIKHFGLNEKKNGFVNVDFTDDEIFDFEIE